MGRLPLAASVEPAWKDRQQGIPANRYKIRTCSVYRNKWLISAAMNPNDEKSVSSLQRAMAIVKALAQAAETGLRVSELCRQLGLTQPTTHRLLQQLIEEGFVEQGEQTRLYRLSIEFFALAARAGDGGGLRELCRPSLLRLGAS